MHALVFEANPDRFERILLRNIHAMDSSMRRMNSSLTSAIKTAHILKRTLYSVYCIGNNDSG